MAGPSTALEKAKARAELAKKEAQQSAPHLWYVCWSNHVHHIYKAKEIERCSWRCICVACIYDYIYHELMGCYKSICIYIYIFRNSYKNIYIYKPTGSWYHMPLELPIVSLQERHQKLVKRGLHLWQWILREWGLGASLGGLHQPLQSNS